MTSYSLTQYRQRLAEAAGWHVFTTTTSAAASADQVITTALKSTELDTKYLKNVWEYQPTGTNAGEVRLVKEGGLANATGTVTLDQTHTNTTGNAVSVEFSGVLPPVDYQGRLGLNKIVNRTLAECWLIHRLQIAAVQDQTEYELGTSFPWLLDENDMLECFYRPSNANANDDDSVVSRWKFKRSADSRKLRLGAPLNTGDLLKPLVYRPLSWWVDPNTGTFAQPSSEGLTNETDKAILPLEGMEIIGLVYVYQELAKWGELADRQHYRELAGLQRIAAEDYKRNNLDQPSDDLRQEHWPNLVSVRSSIYGSWR